MKKYDRDSILERLKDKLKVKLDADDILLFSTNAYILEAVAEEFENIVGYDENLFREAVWDFAQNYSSLFGQSSFFNYGPHRKIGASGSIEVSTSKTFAGGHAYNISIPKLSKFSGGGLTFTNTEAATIPTQASFLNINVVQGIPKSSITEITSAAFPNGTAYATIVIKNPNIEHNHYAVFVNGEEWIEIPMIRLAENGSSKVFCIKTFSDYSGVTIKFGNGVYGKKLTIGDMVTFKFIDTEGSNGNILSAGVITSVDSSFTDERGSTVELFCTNDDIIANGKGNEDIEDIRANAPQSYQTNDRAITTDDYISLIKKSGYAERIIVWGEKETNEDAGNKPGTYIPTTENLIFITGFNLHPITQMGISLTTSDQANIRSFLNTRKGSTDILQFVPVEFVYISFVVKAAISDRTYTMEQVRANIYSTLQSIYSLTNYNFKQNLYFSDYYRVIDGIDGVDHHTTTVSFSEIFKFSSAYEFEANLHLEYVKPGTVSIKVRNQNAGLAWKEIAKDDGNQNIVGVMIDPLHPEMGYYNLPGAFISYEDGSLGEVIVTSGLDLTYTNYEIRVDFELDNAFEVGNLVLTKRQQILSYYNAAITLEFMN